MAFPATPLGVIVELYYSSDWQDITSYVLVRDGITITRGQSDESSSLTPSTCQLTLNNRDGRFSPRNPHSPLYTLIGRNTPIRVRIAEGATSSTRFVGEVSAWPARWDLSGRDVWVPLDAAGILRRLSQGATPLQSALRRELTASATAVAYWPCEDGEGATALGSAMSGAPALRFTGSPELASNEEFIASSPLPVAKTARFTGPVPAYANGAGQLRFLCRIPEAGLTGGARLAAVYTTGTLRRWDLLVDASGNLQVAAFDGISEGATWTTALYAFAVNGKAQRYGLGLAQAGGHIDVTIDTYEQLATVGYRVVETATWVAMGHITRVVIGPDGNLGDSVIGHVCVDTTVTDLSDLGPSINAWVGETVGARLARLGTEHGLTVSTAGASSQTLGAQDRATLVDLLTEAAEVEGSLRELRNGVALAWRSAQHLYNQTPVLTLDYTAAGQVAEGLEPVEDDRDLRNDVTVTRKGGTSARVTRTTGPLSTAAPPDGVGVYDEAVTLSLSRDDQAINQASWRVHLGTLDAQRFASVHVDLAAAPALIPTAVLLDVSWVLQITNPPSWLPPGPIRLMVTGYTETITPYGWDLVYSAVPAQAWDAWTLEDATRGRLASGASTLAAPVTTTATSWQIATAADAPPWIDSATYPAAFPLRLVCDGEEVTCTAITGTSSPQTATVTRSANGIVRAHAAGVAVDLAAPAVVAL